MANKKEAWEQEENQWYQAAREAAQALAERPAFSYDPGADPLYRAARDQALTQARRAMEDSLGRAAGLTGGYASSYAQTQAAQAYDRQLERLTQLLPDYYDRARAAYDRETGALRDSLGTALGFYDKDYAAWLDRQEAAERAQTAAVKQDQWERSFAAQQDRWEQEQTESHERWVRELEAELAKWNAQQAAADAKAQASARDTDRSYAYRMAMLALQQGLRVSDALLETAGISKDYAETIRRYYAGR